MKTEKEQQAEYDCLSHIQQETFNAVKEHKICHDLCLQMAKNYFLVDVRKALGRYRKNEMSFSQYMMFQVQLKELRTREREVYHAIMDKFSTNPGDEYLALQMVRNYDVVNLEEIVSQHKKGSQTIDIFAMEQVKGKCRFPIVEVDADGETEKEYKGAVPF